jgi:hypothetical protein
MKVLMLEERLKQKKTLSTLVILLATGVAGLIHVGEFLMTAEESKDSANGDLLQIWQWLLICTKVG